MSTINPNSFDALKLGLKENYTADDVDALVRADFPFLDFFENGKKGSFRIEKKKGGGRSFKWSLVMDRPMNVNPGTEKGTGGYFPGFSGATNDDIDTITPEEVSLDRAFIYGSTSFTSMQLAPVHGEFGSTL